MNGRLGLPLISPRAEVLEAGQVLRVIRELLEQEDPKDLPEAIVIRPGGTAIMGPSERLDQRVYRASRAPTQK